MAQTDGRSYGRGKRPRSPQEGTLAGAAIAVWCWLATCFWFAGWVLGVW